MNQAQTRSELERFPRSGRIAGTAWGHIADARAPGIDPDLLGKLFVQASREHDDPLTGPDIYLTFEILCTFQAVPIDCPDVESDENDPRLFPRYGVITGTRWADLARRHAGRHEPDQIGALYTGWCLRHLVWRNDRHHEKRFERFCHAYRQRFPRPPPATTHSASRYGAFPQTGSIADTAFAPLARRYAPTASADGVADRYRQRLIVKSDPEVNRHPFRSARGSSFRQDFIQVCTWGFLDPPDI